MDIETQAPSTGEGVATLLTTQMEMVSIANETPQSTGNTESTPEKQASKSKRKDREGNPRYPVIPSSTPSVTSETFSWSSRDTSDTDNSEESSPYSPRTPLVFGTVPSIPVMDNLLAFNPEQLLSLANLCTEFAKNYNIPQKKGIPDNFAFPSEITVYTVGESSPSAPAAEASGQPATPANPPPATATPTTPSTTNAQAQAAAPAAPVPAAVPVPAPATGSDPPQAQTQAPNPTQNPPPPNPPTPASQSNPQTSVPGIPQSLTADSTPVEKLLFYNQSKCPSSFPPFFTQEQWDAHRRNELPKLAKDLGGDLAQLLAGPYSPREPQVSHTATPKDVPSAQVVRPPKFLGDSSQVQSFLYKMKNCVAVLQIPDATQIAYAVQFLEDVALEWWRSLEAATPPAPVAPKTFTQFASALSRRFLQLNDSKLARGEIESIQQGSDTIETYFVRFQRLVITAAVHLPAIDSYTQAQYFTKGLPENYKDRLDNCAISEREKLCDIQGVYEACRALENFGIPGRYRGNPIPQVSKARKQPSEDSQPSPVSQYNLTQNVSDSQAWNKRQKGGYQPYNRSMTPQHPPTQALPAPQAPRTPQAGNAPPKATVNAPAGWKRPDGNGPTGEGNCFVCKLAGHRKLECPVWRQTLHGHNYVRLCRDQHKNPEEIKFPVSQKARFTLNQQVPEPYDFVAVDARKSRHSLMPATVVTPNIETDAKPGFVVLPPKPDTVPSILPAEKTIKSACGSNTDLIMTLNGFLAAGLGTPITRHDSVQPTVDQPHSTQKSTGNAEEQDPLEDLAFAKFVKAKFLCDSGASHSFIGLELARKLQKERPDLEFTPGQGLVRVADGSLKSELGTLDVILSIGNVKILWHLIVVDLGKEHDVILGQDFNVKFRAVLDYNKFRIRINNIPRYGSRIFSVYRPKPVEVENWTEDSNGNKVYPVLSATQFCRDFRKGERLFVVYVNAVGKFDHVTIDDRLKDVPQHLQDAVRQHIKVFDPLPNTLPPIRNQYHCIQLDDNATVPKQRSYRLTPKERLEVESQIKSLLEKGFISPSHSPYGAPVLFKDKSDGTFRMCVDYRALNKQTIKNRFPLPRMDELLDMLTKARFFSSLDLQQAYNQVQLLPEDRPKTAFTTHKGLFEYNVLCFGLANAPSTFQKLMNECLSDLLGQNVICYLDDILIFTETMEEHAVILEKVLARLENAQFYCRIHKCSFGLKRIQFLGWIIENGTKSPNPAKIEIVKDWPVPLDGNAVRKFLGLVGWFREYIQDFVILAEPLQKLIRKPVSLKKGKAIFAPFVWTAEHQQSFDQLKQALVTLPVLHLPDMDKEFTVVCDASAFGVGGILMQDNKVVCFGGRALTEVERRWTTGDRELYGVVYCLQIWRHYLESNRKFTVLTDHNPNVFFQQKAVLSGKQCRWAQVLERFNFDWKYFPGKKNPADPLSRSPQFAALLSAMGHLPLDAMQADGSKYLKQNPVLNLWDVKILSAVQTRRQRQSHRNRPLSPLPESAAPQTTHWTPEGTQTGTGPDSSAPSDPRGHSSPADSGIPPTTIQNPLVTNPRNSTAHSSESGLDGISSIRPGSAPPPQTIGQRRGRSELVSTDSHTHNSTEDSTEQVLSNGPSIRPVPIPPIYQLNPRDPRLARQPDHTPTTFDPRTLNADTQHTRLPNPPGPILHPHKRHRGLGPAGTDYNTERKFHPLEFQALEKLLGKFTVDGCADNQGYNAQCHRYYCPNNSFLTADVSGEQVWMNPPFERIEEFLAHYLSCKARNPSTTSGCIILPVWGAAWNEAVRGMKLVHTYPVGSQIFFDAFGQLMPGTPWAIRVYYDAANQGDYLPDLFPTAPPVDSQDTLTPSKPSVLDAVEAEKAVLEGYSTDPYFAQSKNLLDLEWLNGFYWYKKAMVIPDVYWLKQALLHEVHEANYAGHPGGKRTLDLLRRQFWWPNVSKDVLSYVASCPQCQANKSRTQKMNGLLMPLSIPRRPWDSISMDLITRLPVTARGFDAILVVVDRLTKMTHFIPCKTKSSAEHIAHLLWNNVFKYHGLPLTIVSDRDPRWTGKFFTALMSWMGTRQSLSTAFHPQSDGQTERMNRVLEETLRHYVDPTQSDWDTLLSAAEFAINNATSESTKNTPFFLNLGFHPRTPIADVLPSFAPVSSFVKNQTFAIEHARQCLELAQQRQQTAANSHRRDISFTVGDEVMLDAKNLTLKGPGAKKLFSKYMGPFQIIETINPVAYKLLIPESLGIHPVFHVSLLKPYVTRRDPYGTTCHSNSPDYAGWKHRMGGACVTRSPPTQGK